MAFAMLGLIGSSAATAGDAPIELVLAMKQGDKIDWAHKYGSGVRVTAYNKGAALSDSSSVSEIALPNVGREAHAYLYHIVHRFDTLAAKTVFSPGGMPTSGFHGFAQSGASLLPGAKLEDYLTSDATELLIPTMALSPDAKQFSVRMSLMDNKTEAGLTGGSRYSLCSADGAAGWSPFLPNKFSSTVLEPLMSQQQAKYDFGSFWTRFMGKTPMPERVLAAHSPLFSVSRESIRSRPKAFYEALLAELESTKDPYQAFFLDYMWWYLFHGNTPSPCKSDFEVADSRKSASRALSRKRRLGDVITVLSPFAGQVVQFGQTVPIDFTTTHDGFYRVELWRYGTYMTRLYDSKHMTGAHTAGINWHIYPGPKADDVPVPVAQYVYKWYSAANCAGTASYTSNPTIATSAAAADQTCIVDDGNSFKGEWCDFSGPVPVIHGMYYTGSTTCESAAGAPYTNAGSVNPYQADGRCQDGPNGVGGTSERTTCTAASYSKTFNALRDETHSTDRVWFSFFDKLKPGDRYTIRVCQYDTSPLEQQCDSTFGESGEFSVVKTIDMMSPLRENVFKPGDYVPITWQSYYAAGSTVDIRMFFEGRNIWSALQTSDDGVYTFFVPPDMKPGVYEITVSEPGDTCKTYSCKTSFTMLAETATPPSSPMPPPPPPAPQHPGGNAWEVPIIQAFKGSFGFDEIKRGPTSAADYSTTSTVAGGVNCQYVCHVHDTQVAAGRRRLLFGGLQYYDAVDTNNFVGCSPDMVKCGCCTGR